MSTSSIGLGIVPKIIFIGVAIAATSAVLFVYMYKNGNATPNSRASVYVEPTDIPAPKADIIQITDVFNAVNPQDEWFQLYNSNPNPLTLTNWKVCTSNTCLTIPTTTIPGKSLSKFKVNQFQNWPANGLNGTSDMLGIENNSGAAVDSVNWGTVSLSWRNYNAFRAMLWTPGLQSDASKDQSFFRNAPGVDTNKPSDWITYAKAAPNPVNVSAEEPVEITDVFNAINPQDEWFQLYNQTEKSVTLDGWSACNNSACVDLPKTTIESYSLAKFKAADLYGWPSGGLLATADMFGLMNDKGDPVDSVNWGAPIPSWRNYTVFKDMLWNPGVKVPDVNKDVSYFRQAIAHDTNTPGDWLTTVTEPKTSAGTTAGTGNTSDNPTAQGDPDGSNMNMNVIKKGTCACDLTGDGKVTDADAQKWMSLVKNGTVFGHAATFMGVKKIDENAAADVTKDGYIDLWDFIALRNKIFQEKSNDNPTYHMEVIPPADLSNFPVGTVKVFQLKITSIQKISAVQNPIIENTSSQAPNFSLDFSLLQNTPGVVSNTKAAFTLFVHHIFSTDTVTKFGYGNEETISYYSFEPTTRLPNQITVNVVVKRLNTGGSQLDFATDFEVIGSNGTILQPDKSTYAIIMNQTHLLDLPAVTGAPPDKGTATTQANYDLNDDKSVNTDDGLVFMKCYQSVNDAKQSVQDKNNAKCDFNGDGKIDMNDFVSLLGAMK